MDHRGRPRGRWDVSPAFDGGCKHLTHRNSSSGKQLRRPGALRTPLPKKQWPTTPAKRASSAGAPDVRKLIERGHLDYRVDRVFDGAQWSQACQCGCGRRIKEGDKIVKVTVHQRPATAYLENCWITHVCAHELQFAYLSEFATAARTARNIQPGT